MICNYSMNVNFFYYFYSRCLGCPTTHCPPPLVSATAGGWSYGSPDFSLAGYHLKHSQIFILPQALLWCSGISLDPSTMLCWCEMSAHGGNVQSTEAGAFTVPVTPHFRQTSLEGVLQATWEILMESSPSAHDSDLSNTSSYWLFLVSCLAPSPSHLLPGITSPMKHPLPSACRRLCFGENTWHWV